MVKNLLDLQAKFDTEDKCREYLVQQRWNGVPECPYCSCNRSYKIEGGKRFKCANKDCHKKYSVTVGTVFEASNIPLTKWFAAMYLLTSRKKGISSVQLAKDISVTQKTAWFILCRIRESLKEKNSPLLEDEVQVDETYVGGKVKNMSKTKRASKDKKPKVPVVGLKETNGSVRTIVVPHKLEAINLVKEHLHPDATLVTDADPMYRQVGMNYNHIIINHADKEYKVGQFHTNSIEGYWSHFKRSLLGCYHAVSPKHLQRYCDEQTYRFNNRNMTDGFRFQLSLMEIEGRLKYRTLVGNGKEDKTKEGQ